MGVSSVSNFVMPCARCLEPLNSDTATSLNFNFNIEGEEKSQVALYLYCDSCYQTVREVLSSRGVLVCE